MPELPEVETARRQWARWCCGQVITGVIVRDPRLEAVGAGPLGLVGPAARHGKRLGFPVGSSAYAVHLGMSGRLLRTPLDEPPRFARFGWAIGERAVWLDDSRRFGKVEVLAGEALLPALRQGHGPDAWDELPDPAELAARFRTRQPLKVALLDQARLAGLGNLHAAEALFLAGISPEIPAQALDAPAWERLHRAIRDQLAAAMAELDGEVVQYLSQGASNPFRVYGRVGLPCPRCGGVIAGQKQAGRSTAYCPTCQPRADGPVGAPA